MPDYKKLIEDAEKEIEVSELRKEFFRREWIVEGSRQNSPFLQLLANEESRTNINNKWINFLGDKVGGSIVVEEPKVAGKTKK